MSALDKFEITTALNDIENEIQTNLLTGNERFNKFEKEFDHRFLEDANLKGSAEVLIWSMLDTALALFYIGQNSSVYIELHSLLERYTLRDLPHHLAKDKKSASIVFSLINRMSLNQLFEILVEINIWDSKDIVFAKKLVNIRNGIAHKNPDLITKYLGNGNELHISNIETLVNKIDCVPFILDTVVLLSKLVNAKNKIDHSN